MPEALINKQRLTNRSDNTHTYIKGNGPHKPTVIMPEGHTALSPQSYYGR